MQGTANLRTPPEMTLFMAPQGKGAWLRMQKGKHWLTYETFRVNLPLTNDRTFCRKLEYQNSFNAVTICNSC